jgi:hypothetical protein
MQKHYDVNKHGPLGDFKSIIMAEQSRLEEKLQSVVGARTGNGKGLICKAQ